MSKHILNVKDFGANGDGVNDDSKAVQAAADEADTYTTLCGTCGKHWGLWDKPCPFKAVGKGSEDKKASEHEASQ